MIFHRRDAEDAEKKMIKKEMPHSPKGARKSVDKEKSAGQQPGADSPDTLAHVLDMLRDGLTNEQLDKIEWAMNLEVIQPPDEAAWRE